MDNPNNIIVNAVNAVKNIMENCNQEYIDYIIKRVSTFLNYTQLPFYLENNTVDLETVPKKVRQYIENPASLIEGDNNYLVFIDNYIYTGYIISAILDKYVQDCLIKDKQLYSVLYIDTYLFVEDLKKLINKTDDIIGSLAYSLDVLYKDIRTADFVFWDRFDVDTSNYSLNRIYEILLIRKNRGLHNIFFTTNSPTEFSEIIWYDMFNIMDISNNILNVSTKNIKIEK